MGDIEGDMSTASTEGCLSIGRLIDGTVLECERPAQISRSTSSGAGANNDPTQPASLIAALAVRGHDSKIVSVLKRPVLTSWVRDPLPIASAKQGPSSDLGSVFLRPHDVQRHQGLFFRPGETLLAET